jgi:hypothetical protein
VAVRCRLFIFAPKILAQMKQLLCTLFLACSLFTARSQGPANMKISLPALDKSPMDMAYYPIDYPMMKIQNKVAEPLLARLIYSRPQKNGRQVFGELIEYNKIWRLGANEATEVEFFRDVKLNGKKLPKGRYTMYAIPVAEKWTLIFNRDTDSWGAFKYDEKKDVLRVDVPTRKTAEPAEAFTMEFIKGTAGPELYIAWDDVEVRLPIGK